MSHKLVNTFAVIGIVCLALLVVSSIVTGIVAIGQHETTLWYGVTYVVLVLLAVAVLLSGLIGSIAVLTRKTPE